MLFRKNDGKLVEINRGDYKNERLYYTCLMNLKKSSAVLNPMDAFLQHKSGNVKK